MKIAIVGASGHIGSAVVREARDRGHEVTPVARDASSLGNGVDADVLDRGSIAGVLTGHDAVVLAVKGPETVPAAVRTLIDVLPGIGVRRLLVVGGGGSLEQAPGRRFVDSPNFPKEYLAEARAQGEALDLLRAQGGALDWSYASPPPVHLVDGERTGAYRVKAGDAPISGADTRITIPDFAAALLDTLEEGSFVRERFTAGY
ncbi:MULTISPECIES: NAD(P)-dependent oxidoreductase [Streptosporangium]|uniref:NADH-flavin reductase n=1 Tax=Streptosporangium brasiliense TaxID=47480 RepID=A0ABT9R544_9ACTN|nr:NAD(P)H-binding protein [Streptosporangium brasiliense]MDP9864359.1 putative NADH-flavin reductase [Streptosporangium brasiliense]